MMIVTDIKLTTVVYAVAETDYLGLQNVKRLSF